MTSVLRAPFTTFQEDKGHREAAEAARGRGLRGARRAARLRLLMGPWGAAAYVPAYAVAPGPTRAVATLFTIYGAADVLQVQYARLLENSS